MMQDKTLNRTIRIIVATHKQYWLPDDPVYLPLLVGAANNRTDWDKAKDNTGDNISEKNPFYCELTGLYWACKKRRCRIYRPCSLPKTFCQQKMVEEKERQNHI